MFKKWTVLQLLLLVVIVSIILYWPVSPLWERPMENGRILGFDASSQRVMTVSSDPTARHSPLILHSYDVATGHEVGRKKFEPENNWWVNDCHLINGNQQIYLARRYIDPAKAELVAPANFETGQVKRFEILDATTLETVAGPFPFEGQHWPTFSPDGKWIWTYLSTRGDECPGALIEVATGKVMKEFQHPSGDRPSHAVCFSPDGKAMALQWIHRAMKRWEVEIINLPNGQTRWKHLLPDDPQCYWGLLDHWAGNRLYVQTNLRTKLNGRPYGCSSLEVLADRLGEPRIEPAMTGFTDHDNDIMSHWKFVGNVQVQLQRGNLNFKTNRWLDDTLKWIDRRLGTTLQHLRSITTTVRLSDRESGRTISELKSPRLGYTWMIAMSPDTRHVASVENGYLAYPQSGMGLLLWNARPWPRWPWACGVGVAVFLANRWLSRCWPRRSTQLPA
jgi:hypothetical protein